ncbi:MAG: hypothetical protein GX589_06680, partial [Deltaproteobacteria bacterium]|nr:hypothetical protein [Deltaproteobacteria bacterium]
MPKSLSLPAQRPIFGPLALPLFIFVSGLVIMTAFRLGFVLHFHKRLAETPDYLRLFPIGLRMDVILMSFITIGPAFLCLLLPKNATVKLRAFFCAWAAISLSLILYMEIATFPFIEEYDLRPDRKFLEYLKHPKEVIGTLLGAYELELLIGTIAMVAAAVFFWRQASKIILQYGEFNWKLRLALLPIATPLLVLGARSTLGHRPANLSSATFSNNHLANELALNSTYTVAYAGYRLLSHERSPRKMFGEMEDSEVIERIKNISTTAPSDYIAGQTPMLRHQKSPFELKRPM